MNSRFYQWFGKNFGNGTIPDLLDSWNIPSKHIIRACTYRGADEVITWPSLKHDCCSMLGCLAIVGALAQIRGLANTVQEKCVVFLRAVCSGVKNASFAVLPGAQLVVDDMGSTSLCQLKALVSAKEWASMKSRQLSGYIISVFDFVHLPLNN